MRGAQSIYPVRMRRARLGQNTSKHKILPHDLRPQDQLAVYDVFRSSRLRRALLPLRAFGFRALFVTTLSVATDRR